MALHDYMVLAEPPAAQQPDSPYVPAAFTGDRDVIIPTMEAMQEALASLREALRSQVNAQLNALRQRLASLPASEGASDTPQLALEAACGNLESVLCDIDGAGFAGLMQLSMGVTGAIDSAIRTASAAVSDGAVQGGLLMAEVSVERIEQMSFDAMASSFGVAEYAQMSPEQLAVVQSKLDKGYEEYDAFNRDMQPKIEARAAINGADISEEIEKQKELERKEKLATSKLEIAEIQAEQATNQLIMGEKAGATEEELIALRKAEAEAKARYQEQREKDLGAALAAELQGLSPEEKQARIAEISRERAEAASEKGDQFLTELDTKTEAEIITARTDYLQSSYTQKETLRMDSYGTAQPAEQDASATFMAFTAASSTLGANNNNEYSAASSAATATGVPLSSNIVLAEQQPESDAESQVPGKSPVIANSSSRAV